MFVAAFVATWAAREMGNQVLPALGVTRLTFLTRPAGVTNNLLAISERSLSFPTT
jgi:hypothetical protein